MPGAIAYRDGFEPSTSEETLRVEVLALHGGPVTLAASMLAVAQSIHLTPEDARKLALLLARAAHAASTDEK
jgi:hypothetical protein